jgi:L-amino acid N-acyltransferase YncA
MEHFRIRQAEARDAEHIARIWTHGSALSLGYMPDSADYASYFAGKIASQTLEFKVWLAEATDGSILGWQALLPCRNNPVILHLMAESSTYVAREDTKKGVGLAVMRHALKEAEKSKLQYVIGFVLASNKPMLKIVYTLGWKEVGPLPRALKPPIVDDVIFLIYPVPPPATA